jgi:hypothetical protein
MLLLDRAGKIVYGADCKVIFKASVALIGKVVGFRVGSPAGTLPPGSPPILSSK